MRYLRELFCWHKWKHLTTRRWTNGDITQSYTCSRCLAVRTVKTNLDGKRL